MKNEIIQQKKELKLKRVNLKKASLVVVFGDGVGLGRRWRLWFLGSSVSGLMLLVTKMIW